MRRVAIARILPTPALSVIIRVHCVLAFRRLCKYFIGYKDESLDQPLTADQVAEFFRQGFLVIETPLISKSELEWCSKILMGLLESGKGRSEGRNLDLIEKEAGEETTLPSVLQPSLYSTELRKLSYRKTALAVAKQLLGPQADF